METNAFLCIIGFSVGCSVCVICKQGFLEFFSISIIVILLQSSKVIKCRKYLCVRDRNTLGKMTLEQRKIQFAFHYPCAKKINIFLPSLWPGCKKKLIFMLILNFWRFFTIFNKKLLKRFFMEIFKKIHTFSWIFFLKYIPSSFYSTPSEGPLGKIKFVWMTLNKYKNPLKNFISSLSE